MLSVRWNRFRACSANDEIVSAYAQHTMKSLPRMLSVRWNCFRVCSACNKIVYAAAQHAFRCPCKNCQNFIGHWANAKIRSAYAQHTHAIIFENDSKNQIKLQISTIKNQNFEKPSRNPSHRTKVKILKKNVFLYLSKKIWFRVCSVTAEMFDHRNSGQNQRKRSENLRRPYKDLI